MKVVLFCGGMGMRLREVSEDIPKPLVPIGQRPVLWNLMKYYAHFGHRDFILCLGYRAEAIKNYFINYDERLTNDFVLSGDGANIELLGSDIDDWSITFVDTGIESNVGMRLRAVREHIGDDEVFLANYADGLTDLDLDKYVANFERSGKIASLVSVVAPLSLHVVNADASGNVKELKPMQGDHMRINGGFFAFRREIFEYLGEGEELVEQPFQRLISAGELLAQRHDGFWMAMDTFKDKSRFEQMVRDGKTPWKVWSVEGHQS